MIVQNVMNDPSALDISNCHAIQKKRLDSMVRGTGIVLDTKKEKLFCQSVKKTDTWVLSLF